MNCRFSGVGLRIQFSEYPYLWTIGRAAHWEDCLNQNLDAVSFISHLPKKICRKFVCVYIYTYMCVFMCGNIYRIHLIGLKFIYFNFLKVISFALWDPNIIAFDKNEEHCKMQFELPFVKILNTYLTCGFGPTRSGASGGAS